MSALVGVWKGPMSDTDLERINGLMATVWDTPGQANIRLQALIGVLDAMAKPTPLLDEHGIGFNALR